MLPPRTGVARKRTRPLTRVLLRAAVSAPLVLYRALLGLGKLQNVAWIGHLSTAGSEGE